MTKEIATTILTATVKAARELTANGQHDIAAKALDHAMNQAREAGVDVASVVANA